jgi:hypothetical protein
MSGSQMWAEMAQARQPARYQPRLLSYEEELRPGSRLSDNGGCGQWQHEDGCVGTPEG